MMEHLSTAQLDLLRDLLTREREALLARASQQLAVEAGAVWDTGDFQDAAASEAAKGLEFRLARHELARVHALEAALQRMEEGTYGLCEDSGEEIPFARLQHSPAARYTVGVQELLERGAAARARIGRDVDDEPY